MTPPVRRMVLLSRVEETVRLDGRAFPLSVSEYPGVFHPDGHRYLRAFSHEVHPRWAYQGEGWTLQKQLHLLRGQNTVILSYTALGSGQPLELELRPLFALRNIHELMYQWNGRLEAQETRPGHHRLPATSRTPDVFFAHNGALAPQPCWYLNTIYRREQERGYAGLEDLWMPGIVRWTLAPGESAHFVCSAEPFEFDRALAEAERQDDAAGMLAFPDADDALDMLFSAADQFVVRSADGPPAIMSAYPWCPAAGRDAMIALPGLLLVPGRLEQAQAMLRAFAGLCRDGVMPSELAEDGSGWHYGAADTALWFIHACGEYLRYGGDEAFFHDELLPTIDHILEAYYRGPSALGLAADADGLLQSHSPGLPTTWMDARIGDWVVTPRQGRCVEINALWYNALCVAADGHHRFGRSARGAELLALAHRVKEAFNARFWNEPAQCCFDVVEDHGSDPSIRPNQVFALSLRYPVLDLSRHAAVLETLRRDVLTPVGLRTLSPQDHSYQGHYAGNVQQRDRAQHQGSAFPWLLGAMVTAHVRLHGRGEGSRRRAMELIRPCLQYMRDQGAGQICELFDGDAPHAPGGAPASARSVAELLRCYVEDVLDVPPTVVRTRPRLRAVTLPWAKLNPAQQSR